MEFQSVKTKLAALAILLAAFTILCPVTLAQPNPDNTGNVPIIAADPQVPGTISAQLCNGALCLGGPATYYYWVVAVYQGGSVVSTGPAVAYNAPLVTTATNFVNIRWAPITTSPGVTYDVLRTTSKTWPKSIVTCGPGTLTPVCLLHTGLTTNTDVDNGTPALLSAYTLATFKYPRARSVLTSNNRDYPFPALVLEPPPGGQVVFPTSTVTGSLAGESLNDGANFSAATWTPAGEFAAVGTDAVYTFAATGLGTMTQLVADQAIPGVSSSWYKLEYDVTGNTMVGGVVTITAAYSLAPYQLNVSDVAPEHHVEYFYSAAAPTNFVIDVTGASAGALTLQNMSLRRIVPGDVAAYGMFTGGTPGFGIFIDPRGNVHFGVGLGGRVDNGLPFKAIKFNYLNTWVAIPGTITYCSDCGPNAGAIATCAGVGTGALAVRTSTGWACMGI
jgi:hypothetical protein